jgi:iron complex transport system ATP-binding protein
VVAQEFALEFDFTVAEMVMIGRTPHKGAFDRDDAADHAMVDQAMAQVGCADLAHRGFNTLSGGEKQRVLIALAIAQGADHLILDEPTNHLDIRYQVGRPGHRAPGDRHPAPDPPAHARRAPS